MGKHGARLSENIEHESRVGEFRVKYGFTVRELAKICKCNRDNIVGLQNGMTSPFYERSKRIGEIPYKVGEIKPYVETMAFLFETTISKLFPRYACEIDRKDNLLIYDGKKYDRSDEESTIDVINNKLVFKKFWKQIINKLTPREKDVLEKRFYDGLFLEEIAEDYHLSKESIRLIENKALRRIRGKLGSTIEFKKLGEDLKSCQ